MRVFLSSTSEDLKPYRSAAAEVIRDAQAEAVVMEHFPADPRPVPQMCAEIVGSAELVILLQAHRWGWVPTVSQGGDDTRSVTALEIQAADDQRIPVLAFLADDDWPGRLWEQDDASRAAVCRFRAGINRNAKFFAHETDPRLPRFRALIAQELANCRRAKGAAAPKRAPPRLRQVVSPDFPAEPYPLLAPYEHPQTFGGRSADIERLAQITKQAPLLLCMHAASGTGKSSLLMAGLAPRLRADGFVVSVERAPGEPGLAARLVRDLIETDGNAAPGEAPLTPAAFLEGLVSAREACGRRPVLILDQIDDLWRNDTQRHVALARLGPLLAATAQRMPGSQDFVCKWVLCYRQEFHGAVRAWLEDVLEQARQARVPGVDLLPQDLSDPQRSHDWAVPMVGRVAAGASGEARSVQAFHEAIVKPLQLCHEGQPRYPWYISEEGARRLAESFGRARMRQPDAPLVPELQVVLSHLLQKAASDLPEEGAHGPVEIQVPESAALDQAVRDALAHHLMRALNAIHGAQAESRAGRTRTLLALHQLTDAEGRRTDGLGVDDFVARLGPDGARLLEDLSSPLARLVVVANGRCTLSHDRLAEVVHETVRQEAWSGGTLLDDVLIELQRVVAQKVVLFGVDPGDESGLALTREQRANIRRHQSLFIFDELRRRWWEASGRRSEALRRRTLLQATAAAALGVAAVTAIAPPAVRVQSELLALPVSRWTVGDAYAVAALPDGGVLRWRIGEPWTGRTLAAKGVRDVAANGDGGQVVGITDEGTLRAWAPGAASAASAPAALVLPKDFERFGNSAVLLSPSGEHVAAAFPSGDVYVWSTQDFASANAPRATIELPRWGEHKQPPGMVFSEGGRWLLLVDGNKHVWILETDGKLAATNIGRYAGAQHQARASFSADERWLFWTKDEGGRARFVITELPGLRTVAMEADDFPCRRSAENSLGSRTVISAFSSDSRVLAARYNFAPVCIWRLAGNAWGAPDLAVGKPYDGSDWLVGFEVSGDSKWIATTVDFRLFVWPLARPPGADASPLHPERYNSRGPGLPVTAFSPDGASMASIAPDGAVHHWQLTGAVQQGERLNYILTGGRLRYSADSTHLYGSDPYQVALGPAGGPLTGVLTGAKDLSHIAVSSDRRRLFAFDKSGVTTLTRVQTFWGIPLWGVEWPALAPASEPR